jgi:hypothetical protein
MKISYNITWQHMLTVNLTSSSQRNCRGSSVSRPQTKFCSYVNSLIYIQRHKYNLLPAAQILHIVNENPTSRFQ